MIKQVNIDGEPILGMMIRDWRQHWRMAVMEIHTAINKVNNFTWQVSFESVFTRFAIQLLASLYLLSCRTGIDDENEYVHSDFLINIDSSTDTTYVASESGYYEIYPYLEVDDASNVINDIEHIYGTSVEICIDNKCNTLTIDRNSEYGVTVGGVINFEGVNKRYINIGSVIRIRTIVLTNGDINFSVEKTSSP